jgi:two-component system, NarL family, nitrate/nitrite response regulator NarL
MRIVICDDHWLLLEALSTALATHGFVVEAATTTPAAAVRAVALHDPDLLLTDVTFPEGDGLDAARSVIEHHPRTKVVMITASDAMEPLLEALEIGVHGYVRKDQKIANIARVLEQAARGEVAVDQGLLRRLTRGNSRTARVRTPIDGLTPRERHVLGLLVEGLSTSDIVAALDITHSTARTHVQSILSKLGVHSRVQAVAMLADEVSNSLGDDVHEALKTAAGSRVHTD